MREGRESKMFTLWQITSSEHYTNERFVKNLSTDRAKAWKLAEARAKSAGCELFDEAVEDLNDIVRGEDVLRFGRYRDQRIVDLPDQYLLYIAKGAPYKNERGFDCFAAPKNQIEFAQAEALKRGLYCEHEGRLIPVRLRDAIVKFASGWGHHFEDKAKVELTLTFLKGTAFDTMFGTQFVEIFEDQDGRKFEYKGSNPVSLPYTEDDNGQEMIVRPGQTFEDDRSIYSRALTVGDTITVKATVKLGNYREKNVTYLQRIKLI